MLTYTRSALYANCLRRFSASSCGTANIATLSAAASSPPSSSSTTAHLAVAELTAIITSTTTPSLHQQRRHRSFHIFIDEDDPDITLRHAREVKTKEEEAGNKFSTKYLHALINVAVAHYQKKDFSKARQCALYAHQMIVEKRGPRHMMAYFSATTCAKCSRALCAELTGVVNEREEMGNPSATLEADVCSSLLSTNEKSTSFRSVNEFIGFLNQEAVRYERIAQRVIHAPDKFFMRTEAQHQEAAAREDGQFSSDFDYNTASGGVGGGGSKSDARRRKYEAEVRRGRVAEAQKAYEEQSVARGRPGSSTSYQSRHGKKEWWKLKMYPRQPITTVVVPR